MFFKSKEVREIENKIIDSIRSEDLNLLKELLESADYYQSGHLFILESIKLSKPTFFNYLINSRDFLPQINFLNHGYTLINATIEEKNHFIFEKLIENKEIISSIKKFYLRNSSRGLISQAFMINEYDIVNTLFNKNIYKRMEVKMISCALIAKEKEHFILFKNKLLFKYIKENKNDLLEDFNALLINENLVNF